MHNSALARENIRKLKSQNNRNTFNRKSKNFDIKKKRLNVHDINKNGFKTQSNLIKNLTKLIDYPIIPVITHKGYEHVLERSKERLSDFQDIIEAMAILRKNHLCELIFAVKKQNYTDIEFKYKELILVFKKRYDKEGTILFLNTVLNSKYQNSKYIKIENYQIVHKEDM